jgi:hypothetical protein
VDSFKILPSKLSQTVGGGHFFVCHNIWEVAKIKICQTNYPKLLELLLVASTTLLGCYDGVTLFYRLIKYRVFGLQHILKSLFGHTQLIELVPGTSPKSDWCVAHCLQLTNPFHPGK